MGISFAKKMMIFSLYETEYSGGEGVVIKAL
jgi:hypothetical protein